MPSARNLIAFCKLDINHASTVQGEVAAKQTEGLSLRGIVDAVAISIGGRDYHGLCPHNDTCRLYAQTYSLSLRGAIAPWQSLFEPPALPPPGCNQVKKQPLPIFREGLLVYKFNYNAVRVFYNLILILYNQ